MASQKRKRPTTKSKQKISPSSLQLSESTLKDQQQQRQQTKRKNMSELSKPHVFKVGLNRLISLHPSYYKGAIQQLEQLSEQLKSLEQEKNQLNNKLIENVESEFDQLNDRLFKIEKKKHNLQIKYNQVQQTLLSLQDSYQQGQIPISEALKVPIPIPWLKSAITTSVKQCSLMAFLRSRLANMYLLSSLSEEEQKERSMSLMKQVMYPAPPFLDRTFFDRCLKFVCDWDKEMKILKSEFISRSKKKTNNHNNSSNTDANNDNNVNDTEMKNNDPVLPSLIITTNINNIDNVSADTNNTPITINITTNVNCQQTPRTKETKTRDTRWELPLKNMAMEFKEQVRLTRFEIPKYEPFIQQSMMYLADQMTTNTSQNVSRNFGMWLKNYFRSLIPDNAPLLLPKRDSKGKVTYNPSKHSYYNMMSGRMSLYARGIESKKYNLDEWVPLYYRNIVIPIRSELRPLFWDESKTLTSKNIENNIWKILRISYRMLKTCEEKMKSLRENNIQTYKVPFRLWSLFPICSPHICHIRIDTATMAYMHYRYNNPKKKTLAFFKEQKEKIWEGILFIKNRMRVSKKWIFDGSIITDGVSCGVQFCRGLTDEEKRIKEENKKKKEEEQKEKKKRQQEQQQISTKKKPRKRQRKQSTTTTNQQQEQQPKQEEWKKKAIEKTKNIDKLDCVIFGVDPGRKNILTVVAKDNEGNIRCRTRLPSQHYHLLLNSVGKSAKLLKETSHTKTKIKTKTTSMGSSSSPSSIECIPEKQNIRTSNSNILLNNSLETCSHIVSHQKGYYESEVYRRNRWDTFINRKRIIHSFIKDTIQRASVQKQQSLSSHMKPTSNNNNKKKKRRITKKKMKECGPKKKNKRNKQYERVYSSKETKTQQNKQDKESNKINIKKIPKKKQKKVRQSNVRLGTKNTNDQQQKNNGKQKHSSPFPSVAVFSLGNAKFDSTIGTTDSAGASCNRLAETVLKCRSDIRVVEVSEYRTTKDCHICGEKTTPFRERVFSPLVSSLSTTKDKEKQKNTSATTVIEGKSKMKEQWNARHCEGKSRKDNQTIHIHKPRAIHRDYNAAINIGNRLMLLMGASAH